MSTKSIIYCRVSSGEQEETRYSLPAQEKLLKEYAVRKGLEVTKVFSIAESASGAKQRQVFNEMIEYAQKHNITDLLIEKVDRLTRNLKDAVVVNEWVDFDENRKVHFVKQNLIIHRYAKSDEKFRWDIEIVLAKKYIANLSEEVRKGQKEKLEQGWLPTKPPIGYKTVGDKGKKIHVIDPENSIFIKKAYTYYATGNYSMKALIDKLFEDGFRTRAGKRMVKSRIEDILKEPFYYGCMVWKDILYSGKHEPIISKELFDKVQEVRTGRKTPYKSRHDFTFKKMIKCEECDGTITAEIQKGYVYYHCNHYKNCTQKEYVREEDITNQILSVLSVFENLTEEEANEISAKIRQNHIQEIEYKQNAINTLQERYNHLQRRLEVLYDDRLDEKISGPFWEAKKKEIDTEQSNILQDLNRIKSEETKYYEIGLNIINLARRAKEIFLNKRRTPGERRQLLSYLFSSLKLNGKKLSYTPVATVEVISKRLTKRISAQNTFEQKRALSNKALSENLPKSCSLLRG